MKRMKRVCESCQKRVSPRALTRGKAKELNGKFWHTKCMGSEQTTTLKQLSDLNKVDLEYVVVEHRLTSCYNACVRLLESKSKYVDAARIEKLKQIIETEINVVKQLNKTERD